MQSSRSRTQADFFLTQSNLTKTFRSTSCSNHIRDEQIRHPPLVLGPAFPILFLALLPVSPRSVQDHARKEQRIEPRKRGVEASDQAPRYGEEEVARVMDLAGVFICGKSCSQHLYNPLSLEQQGRWGVVSEKLTPAVNENGITDTGLDQVRILDFPPRQLRESLSLHNSAALRRSITILLAVSRVPHPIHDEVARIERDKSRFAPLVLCWIVIGEVYRAVAV
jgi:hypothetical protein